MRIVALVPFVLALVLIISPINARAAEIFGGASSIELTVSPEFPTSYSTVTITPRSTLVPLERSDSTVTADGVVVFKGSGSEPISITLGPAGKPVTISVSATVDGATYKKSFTITPQDLSLIVEPTATTHPLYAGASLVPSQGHLRIIALADFHTAAGARIPSNNLSYTWHFGDKLLSSQSGIGKSVLDATAPMRYRSADVSVTVTTPDQNSIAGGRISISPQDPSIRIYKNDPLQGPDYDNALSGSTALAGSEETFRVVPYFFSSLPTIAWTVNSTSSGSEKDITLRPTGTGAGTATIGVSASRESDFQSASQTLSVSFGASQPLGIFGL